MISLRKRSIIVGAFFLTVMISWVIGAEVFIEPILRAPDFLAKASLQQNRLLLGFLFEIINFCVVIGIAAMMYPVLRKHNEQLALGYVSFRIIETALLAVSLAGPIMLISFSHDFIQAGSPSSSHFQTLGTLALGLRNGTGQMVPIFVGLGGVMFCIVLLKAKLLPAFLPIWGIIGYALLTTVPVFTFSGFENIMLLAIPGGFFELFLGIFLIVKGFKTPPGEENTAMVQ